MHIGPTAGTSEAQNPLNGVADWSYYNFVSLQILMYRYDAFLSVYR